MRGNVRGILERKTSNKGNERGAQKLKHGSLKQRARRIRRDHGNWGQEVIMQSDLICLTLQAGGKHLGR